MKPLGAKNGSDISGSTSVLMPPSTSVISEFPPATSQRSSSVHRDFSRLLNEALAAATEWEDVQAAVASVLQSSAGCSFVGWYSPRGTLIGQTAQLEGLTCPEDGLAAAQRQSISQTAADCCQQKSTSIQETASKADLIVSAFVPAAGGAIVSIVPNDDDGCRTAVELAAEKIGAWLLLQEAAQTVQDSQHIAALVELVGRLSEADTLSFATQVLVDELQKYLGATDVSVGLCADERLQCRLSSVSGSSHFDPLSPESRTIESALQESIARGTISQWPPGDDSTRHALLSLQYLAETTGATSIMAAPLRSDSGNVAGALLVQFRPRDAAASDIDPPCDRAFLKTRMHAATAFLRAAAPILASTLLARQRQSRSMVARTSLWLKKVFGGHVVRTLAVVSAVVAAVLLIPVDYRVHGDAELQPVLRRFVAVPFDAPLEQCLVDPGDVVTRDQVLARLDGRELRWELAGVRADLAKATKEHNTHLSEQHFGEAAIARHEIDRLQNRAALLSERDRSLDVRSPIDGVVVSGDLRDTEGVPLKTGQSLFEVAPLDRMVIEVAVPEEDIRHVQQEMAVRVQLDAMPATVLDATILRVHPKAELREHENVFIVEAEIDNADAVLRPGMKGSAGISTGYRPLGWNLFHKPAAYVLGWLGW